MAKTIAPEGKMAKALQHLEKIVAAPPRRLHFPRLPQINKAWYIGLAAGIITAATITGVVIDLSIPGLTHQTYNPPAVPTISPDVIESNRRRQEQLLLDGAIRSELSSLRSFENSPQLAAELADLIETTFGQSGYNAKELSMIRNMRQVAGIASTRASEVIADLKAILQTQSYRSTVITIGDRNLELIVLASDPVRAPFYFDALQRIIPKVEAFTGLKYEEPVLVIHSQPKNDLGAAYALGSGLSMSYPQGPEGTNKVVLRRYETTTQGKAVEETAAHEFDHKLGNPHNMPVWLAEGKANFTAYHALRTKNGLPTTDEPFADYRNNAEINVRSIYDGIIPPVSEHNDTYTEIKEPKSEVMWLGQLLLDDILAVIGRENMSNVIKEINIRAPKEFITLPVFQETVLKYTPNELQTQMNKFLQERLYGQPTAMQH